MAGEPASALHDVKRVLRKIFRCARKTRSRRERDTVATAASGVGPPPAEAAQQGNAADPGAHASTSAPPIQSPPSHSIAPAHDDNHSSQSAAPKIDVLFDTDKDQGKDGKPGDDHPWLAAVDSPQDTIITSTTGEGSAAKTQKIDVASDQPPPSHAAEQSVPKEPSEPAAATKPDDSQPAEHLESSEKEVDECPMPPIKSVQLAPGMSATSGPLEDYPEDGETGNQA